MATDIATLGIKVESGQVKTAGRELDSFAAKGAKAEGATKKLTSAVGGLVGGLLAFETARRGVVYAVDAFATLDKGLIGVKKTTGIAGAELDALGETIQEISTRIPVATEELLAIAQAAGQLGVQGSKNIAKFTETVAMLGTASDLAGDEAATTLARLMTVTGEAADEVDVLGSVIVALGNNMAATEKEIAWMATQVAQATAVFNISSAEAAALGAAMRSIGIRAELGGSAVGRAMRAIDKAIRSGGDSFEYLTRLTDMTGEELKQTFETDAVRVFQAFIEGLGRVTASGESVAAAMEVFGLKGEELLKVLPAMARSSNELAKALDLAGEEVKNNTALYNEAMEAAGSFSAKMEILGNKIDIEAAKLGEDLAPAVLEVTGAIVDLCGWVVKLGEYWARIHFIGSEFAAGRLSLFDEEMWDDEAAKRYVENLDALTMAERKLAQLKASNTSIYADERAEKERQIEQMERSIDMLKQMRAEEEATAKLRAAIGETESAWDARAKASASLDESLVDSPGGGGSKTTKKPPYILAGSKEHLAYQLQQYEDLWDARQQGEADVDAAILEKEQEWLLARSTLYDETMQALHGIEDDFSNTQAGRVLARVDRERWASDQMTGIWEEWGGEFEGIMLQAGDAFADFLLDGEAEFSSFADSIIRDLARVVMQMAVIQPLASGITSFAGSLFSGGSVGAGLSFTTPGMTAANGYDSGGWVNEPVVGVGLSSGQSYSFAERGPELVSNPRKGQVDGGDKIQVVQNFNLSPGVPEAVRREVSAMMPYVQTQTIRALDERNQRGRRK